MAQHTIDVLFALRNTSQRLQSTTEYQWGHMGSCNCGFLAQEVTKLSRDEIHSRAMQKHGDWQTQIKDYCPTSGLLMDDLITEMLAFGFDHADLQHLETLSDPEILQRLPATRRHLQRNNKDDVMLYINEWAELIEERVIQKMVTNPAMELMDVV